MWTSKLGNKYERAWIEAHHSSTQADLKRMRGVKDKDNHCCADCNQLDTTWASISHGSFICITCSDVHRSVGTHISKVKGCTGTYYWGPDEIERMSGGNLAAERLYGAQKVSPDASKEEKQRYVINKYEKRLFAPIGAVALARAVKENVRPQTEVGSVSSSGTSVPAVAVQAFSRPPSRPAAAVIPDNVFDELFQDWGTSPKANAAGTAATSAIELHDAVRLPPCMPAAVVPDKVFDELFHDWGTSPKANAAGAAAKSAIELHDAARGLPCGLFLGVECGEALSPVGVVRGQAESTAQPERVSQERRFLNALDDVDEIFAVLHGA